MSICVPHGFVPREYQLKLFQAMDGQQGKPETKKRYAFLRWHRRAGKDMACLAYMFKEMMTTPGTYYYFLPNYQQGRKIIWEGDNGQVGDRYLRYLDMLPAELIKHKTNQDMKLETINGSIFRVIGTDNIDSIVGTNPRGCIFSEYSLQDPNAWEFIRPIITVNGGWVIFNGTPRGRNHMYNLDLRVRDNNTFYYSELQTLWPDQDNYSGIVAPDQIQAERDTGMDEDTIAQEYGVSYAAASKGAIYQDLVEKARKDGRIGEYIYDSNAWVDTFWDLGWNDFTSVWFRQIIGNRVIWIDYFEDRQKPLSYYIEMLKEKGYKYRSHHLPHDGAQHSLHTGMSTFEMFRILLKQADLTDDVIEVQRMSKQEGINATRARFARYCFNETNCYEAIDKLSLYKRKWDERRKILLKEPVHDWTSHCADALRTEASFEDLVFEDYETYEGQPINVIGDYDVFK